MANWMNTNKRLQSALELLTTYGFALALTSIVIIILFYFLTPSTQIVPSSCSVYGSVHCINAEYYSNTVANNANVILYLSNAGSSPANIISVNVLINGLSFSGTCATNQQYQYGNTVVYPGSNTICSTLVSSKAPNVGSKIQGEFSLDMQICNSGVSQLSTTSCTFSAAPVTGSFTAYASTAK